MSTLEKIKIEIAGAVNRAVGKRLVKAEDLISPPKPEFGDLSLACFNLAKNFNKSAVAMAEELVKKVKIGGWLVGVKAIGPYLNFTLNKAKLAEDVINLINKEKNSYGKNNSGKNKKIMVEFAHPNTHKAFHIGHLRNIVTGESIARLLENSGFSVVRVNYQGDIGPHIAKCLWGINQLEQEYKQAKKNGFKEKALFLGQAYALGSKNYESDQAVRKEIIDLSKKLYENDRKILKLYRETRQWSLKYFDSLYKRLGTKFDRLYFESEVAHRGRELTLKSLKKGIFKVSDGAVIFEGEKYGLHNRVFINSDGNPTYEAKDMGLAELQFKDSPEKIIHIVGPEQSEYFKVIFKALELVMPEAKGREIHVPYGWVKLKQGKMSSRLGNVILGEWLLDEIKKEIAKIAGKNKKLKNKEAVSEKISMAAVKYSILKNGVTKDIAFDIDESISLSGNSGPYLDYTYARIQSIIKKAKKQESDKAKVQFDKLAEMKESNIVLKLAKYPEAVALAGKNYDPSEMAKYLFELGKDFNDYYHSVPVLKAGRDVKNARLALISAVSQVIANGLALLGIETVEEM